MPSWAIGIATMIGWLNDHWTQCQISSRYSGIFGQSLWSPSRTRVLKPEDVLALVSNGTRREPHPGISQSNRCGSIAGPGFDAIAFASPVCPRRAGRLHCRLGRESARDLQKMPGRCQMGPAAAAARDGPCRRQTVGAAGDCHERLEDARAARNYPSHNF